MANREMATFVVALTLALVLFVFSCAVDVAEVREKAEPVALPEHDQFKADTAAKAIVIPAGNLELLKGLRYDPENSETNEDHEYKANDEKVAWLEVSPESAVKDGNPSDFESVQLTVISFGHRGHRDCRRKPWFRRLPHREIDRNHETVFTKSMVGDVTLNPVILDVKHSEQIPSIGNWKEQSTKPHNILNQSNDDEESKEEEAEIEKKEDEKGELKDEKTENDVKEVKPENKQKQENAESKPPKEEEKGSTDENEQNVFKIFRKIMDF